MPENEAAKAPPLRMLAWIIARAANRTFGGGTATSEVLRRSLVWRGWITDDDHRHLYALSRLTPGTNLLAYCTAVGWQTRGTRGAVIAWLASSIPSAVLGVAATILYERLAASATFGVVMLLAMAVALVLLGASAWHLAKPQLSRPAAPRSTAVAVFVLGLTALGTSPVYVLLLAAAVGAAWGHRQ